MERTVPIKSSIDTVDTAVKKAIHAAENVRRLLRRQPVRERVKRELNAAASVQTFQ